METPKKGTHPKPYLGFRGNGMFGRMIWALALSPSVQAKGKEKERKAREARFRV